MANQHYELTRCHDESDKIPIQEWLDDLDRVTRNRIRVQIDKMEDGNFGDVWPVGKGVSETRMDFGPGYRVYHATKRNEVHLLGGGSKATQQSDINAALRLWETHEKN